LWVSIRRCGLKSLSSYEALGWVGHGKKFGRGKGEEGGKKKEGRRRKKGLTEFSQNHRRPAPAADLEWTERKKGDQRKGEKKKKGRAKFAMMMS